MTAIACMGGFCTRRDKCRLYDQPRATVIAERLCEPGEHDSYEPVRVVRAAGSWEGGSVAGELMPGRWAEPIH